MCGISGIWLKQTSSGDLKDTIYKLSQTLKHRGPDGEGFMLASSTETIAFASEDTPEFKNRTLNYSPHQHLKNAGSEFNLAFGHRRLSIIDLSDTGHQPMADKEGGLWITFNGEIYNYIELRKELEAFGHRFISSSDTEVILAAYKQWGTACQAKFNGMWAFCIYDRKKQLLFCSRDRFGVKPFYYTDNADLFAFASEQKAFIKSGLLPFSVNDKAIHDHLVNERIEAEPESFFKGILELFPGHQLVADLKQKTISVLKWYTLKFEYDPATDALSDDTIIQRIREKLERAVELRLRSDVPVGSCLSGGIDSSVIAGLIRKHSKHPLYLFTSMFANDESDESRFAELVAKKVNGNYKTVE
ncbi:MAG: asparagine synthase (glutamine-hydrolyzing), partial [Bacteroidia bacterium]